jgi:hypothetical protein
MMHNYNAAIRALIAREILTLLGAALLVSADGQRTSHQANQTTPHQTILAVLQGLVVSIGRRARGDRRHSVVTETYAELALGKAAEAMERAA